MRGLKPPSPSVSARPSGSISPSSGAEALFILRLFTARLKPHPIDEDLSMGTPVKSCPDTSCGHEGVFRKVNCPCKMASPGREGFPAGAVVGAAKHSAKGPVSRILSCAVIPLGAALPRTLISDLPGGFGNCYEAPQRRRLEHPSKQRSLAGSPACRRGPRLSRLGAPGRCAALHDSMQTLPSLFGLAPCGVYPAPGVTAGAVRSYRTISPLPWH